VIATVSGIGIGRGTGIAIGTETETETIPGDGGIELELHHLDALHPGALHGALRLGDVAPFDLPIALSAQGLHEETGTVIGPMFTTRG